MNEDYHKILADLITIEQLSIETKSRPIDIYFSLLLNNKNNLFYIHDFTIFSLNWRGDHLLFPLFDKKKQITIKKGRAPDAIASNVLDLKTIIFYRLNKDISPSIANVLINKKNIGKEFTFSKCPFPNKLKNQNLLCNHIINILEDELIIMTTIFKNQGQSLGNQDTCPYIMLEGPNLSFGILPEFKDEYRPYPKVYIYRLIKLYNIFINKVDYDSKFMKTKSSKYELSFNKIFEKLLEVDFISETPLRNLFKQIKYLEKINT